MSVEVMLNSEWMTKKIYPEGTKWEKDREDGSLTVYDDDDDALAEFSRGAWFGVEHA